MTTTFSGPWRHFSHLSADGLPEIVITAANGCPIATVGNHTEYKETARLIVSTPDLLAAARRLSAWIDRERISYLIDSDDNPGQALRNAIAKAEGRS